MSTSTISREKFLKELEARNPGQPEFIQAVAEVIQVILPYIEEHPEYQQANILERIVEPERVLMFRVPWVDDAGNYRINRGYRIQMNNAIGP